MQDDFSSFSINKNKGASSKYRPFKQARTGDQTTSINLNFATTSVIGFRIPLLLLSSALEKISDYSMQTPSNVHVHMEHYDLC